MGLNPESVSWIWSLSCMDQVIEVFPVSVIQTTSMEEYLDWVQNKALLCLLIGMPLFPANLYV